jgi:hypothetical protein
MRVWRRVRITMLVALTVTALLAAVLIVSLARSADAKAPHLAESTVAVID